MSLHLYDPEEEAGKNSVELIGLG